MITRIEVRGFRALRDVDVPIKEFQVLVGPNGSGKSTFIDTVAFLRDFLRFGLETAVWGDSYARVQMRAADPLELSYLRIRDPILFAIEARAPKSLVQDDGSCHMIRYELAVDLSGGPTVREETLWLETDNSHDESNSEIPYRQHVLFPPRDFAEPKWNRESSSHGWKRIIAKTDSGADYLRSETSDWKGTFRFGPEKSVLANLPEDQDMFPRTIWFKRLLLEQICVLALDAQKIRLPSQARSAKRMLPDGSNLPWAVHRLESETPEKLVDWIDHVRTAYRDIRHIRTVEKPEDGSRYIEIEYASGLVAPSWAISDGTLRLLALTALAYFPSTGTILIEEPENGIHPQAIQTVVESLSSVYNAQVFLATHSTVVLSRLHANQLLCFSRARDGSVSIVPGDKHPYVGDWKDAIHLGDLLAMGVLG
ncbi:MAG: ATP-binding protein [Polyangiaceae bacterium]|nr:ATP-binding protein [Polyangiaceae bacterium]